MPPKCLYLIRHAQGYHNLCVENHAIRDPVLTTTGEQQCIHLANEMRDMSSIDCIVASPLRRALYTALILFQAALLEKPHLKIVALPELQETSNLPCDTGSPVDELREEFRGKPVDLSRVQEGWFEKDSGPFAPDSTQIDARCQIVRRFLVERNERNIAVVTHGAVLHYLTGDWVGALNGCVFCTSNAKLAHVEDIIDHARHRLVELRAADVPIRYIITSCYRQRFDHRGIFSSQPQKQTYTWCSPEEQAKLRAAAEVSWAKHGYIVLSDQADLKSRSNREDRIQATRQSRWWISIIRVFRCCIRPA